MKNKKHIVVFLFAIIIANNCLCQDIRPKNKMKIDSLYPNARIVGWNGPHGSTQNVEIKCNCPEFGSYITLTFDTNANILLKEYYFNSLKYLPDTILSYIKRNISKTFKIDSVNTSKFINYEGEISYGIRVNENGTWYNINLKSSGEIISKTQEIRGRE
jgi:hypothetical protein